MFYISITDKMLCEMCTNIYFYLAIKIDVNVMSEIPLTKPIRLLQ